MLLIDIMECRIFCSNLRRRIAFCRPCGCPQGMKTAQCRYKCWVPKEDFHDTLYGQGKTRQDKTRNEKPRENERIWIVSELPKKNRTHHPMARSTPDQIGEDPSHRYGQMAVPTRWYQCASAVSHDPSDEPLDQIMS